MVILAGFFSSIHSESKFVMFIKLWMLDGFAL